MSQEPPKLIQTACCGQLRPEAETRSISSVNLYIGVIKHLTSAEGVPSFGNPDTKLANPGDIFDILVANDVFSTEPPFFDAAAVLASMNNKAAPIASCYAELLAATNYLELLPDIKEDIILNFIKTKERWDVCFSTGAQRCCAGTLRNINRNGSITVSISHNFFLFSYCGDNEFKCIV
jgi:hypothetical protein